MFIITENTCRICLKDSGPNSELIETCRIENQIFAKWYNNFVWPDIETITKLENCVKFVCSRCKLKMISVELFRQQCINNELLLKKLYAQDDDLVDDFIEIVEDDWIYPQDNLDKIEVKDDQQLETDLDACILQVLSMVKNTEKGNFLCKICQHKFNFKYDLKRHCFRHFGIEIDKPGCDYCSTTFTTHNDLKSHVQNKHFDKGVLKCDKCSKQFYNMFTYKVHTLSPHKAHSKQIRKDHICSICGFKTNRLSEHLSSHRSENERFMCELCPDKRYRRKEDLKQHIKSVHLKQKLRKCNHCNMKFSTWISLQTHLIKDHNLKDFPFKCTYCSYKCCTKNRYIQHLGTHDESKLYNLRIQQPIENHLIHHTYTTNKNDPLTVALFQCPLCEEKPIFNFIELRSHFSILHPDFEMKTK